MTALKVTLWDMVIGYLAWDEKNNTSIFESSNEYLGSPLNIAPFIHPNKKDKLIGADFHEKFNGLIPCFSDSLPDYFGDIVFKEWLEQLQLDQSSMNPVERLLYVGTTGIGGLEYHDAKVIPSTGKPLNLEYLAILSDKIIKGNYGKEDFLKDSGTLQHLLSIGSSVGGAQAKIMLALHNDADQMEWLPGNVLHKNNSVEYYIVKLDHDPHHIWQREKHLVEFVYHQMAKEIGIHTADTRLIQDGERTHFASKRFDRIGQKKLHQQTASALLGFFGKSAEIGYEDIFKLMEFLGLSHMEKEQLFTQMVFNVVYSNRDDHTKNFSFLMDETGTWSLSPAYDLTFPFDPYRNFRMPHKISINKKLKEISKKDIQSVARKVGITNDHRILNRVIESSRSVSKRLAESGVSDKTVDLMVKDIQRNLSFLNS